MQFKTDAVLSQASNHSSSQLFSQWPTSSQDENTSSQSQQQLKSSLQLEQNSSDLEQKQHGSGVENQQQVDASRELNRLPLQQKQPLDDPQQLQSEQMQFSQAPGIQISEKNSGPIPEPDTIHNPDKQHQFPDLQKINNEQGTTTEQASNSGNQNKHIPFGMLLPSIIPHLDKDRALQLRTLYAKLKVGLWQASIHELFCFVGFTRFFSC